MSINFSFGFVEMGSEKEAMEAAKALDGTKLLGRQVGQYLFCNNKQRVGFAYKIFLNNDLTVRNVLRMDGYSHHNHTESML